jgi:hypothetical protein
VVLPLPALLLLPRLPKLLLPVLLPLLLLLAVLPPDPLLLPAVLCK